MGETQTISKAIIICGWLLPSISLFAAEQPPGIAITGTTDISAKKIPILKMEYRTCVMMHKSVQAAMDEGGVASVAVKNDLPPGYLINGPPMPEPIWEKTNVGKGRFEEYFENDKYALYTYGFSHEISDDGKCRLEEKEFVKITLDDGKEKYRIKLDGRLTVNSADGSAASSVPMKYDYANGSVDRQPSPALIHHEVDRNLQDLAQLLKENPEVMRELSKGLVPQKGAVGTAPPGDIGEHRSESVNPPASGGDTLSRIKDSLGYDKNTYRHPQQPTPTENFVADQACDIVSMKTLESRIWYWHRMNKYPSTESRPIILKKENRLAGGDDYKTTYKADSFSWNIDINDAYFRPEPELRKPGRWKHPLFDPKPQKRTQIPIPEKGSPGYDQFMLTMMIDVIQKRKDLSWEEKDQKIKSLRLAYKEGYLQNLWNRID
jgi:hypothetical protein